MGIVIYEKEESVGMIRLYHSSSYTRIENPDTRHCRKALDFGRGFYLTPVRVHAERYAERFSRAGEEAWLNIYDLSEDWDGWKVKRFPCYDDEWLDFIVRCRKGETAGDYDMVSGGIVDDGIFVPVSLYFSGYVSWDETLRRLSYEEPNLQYCIRNERMLKQCLTFIDSVRL